MILIFVRKCVNEVKQKYYYDSLRAQSMLLGAMQLMVNSFGLLIHFKYVRCSCERLRQIFTNLDDFELVYLCLENLNVSNATLDGDVR